MYLDVSAHRDSFHWAGCGLLLETAAHENLLLRMLGPGGLGAYLGSAALAQVVFFVSRNAVVLSSFIRFDVLV